MAVGGARVGTPPGAPRAPRAGRRPLSVLAAGIVVVGVGFGLAALRSPAWYEVGSADFLRENQIAYVEPLRVFAVWGPKGPLAFSALSPRRPETGERVLYCRAWGFFVGPHHEIFDAQGRYVAGPAPRGLDRAPVRVTDGIVSVKPAPILPGFPPGTAEPRIPDGPRCEPSAAEDPPGFFSAR